MMWNGKIRIFGLLLLEVWQNIWEETQKMQMVFLSDLEIKSANMYKTRDWKKKFMYIFKTRILYVYFQDKNSLFWSKIYIFQVNNNFYHISCTIVLSLCHLIDWNYISETSPSSDEFEIKLQLNISQFWKFIRWCCPTSNMIHIFFVSVLGLLFV